MPRYTSWAKIARGLSLSAKELKLLMEGQNPWASMKTTVYAPIKTRPKRIRGDRRKRRAANRSSNHPPRPQR
ncbi:MAG: hypothetical protein L0177_16810 [Chloroflexi bacterium]|nr:hypothetical protein [Chloroflexota bacterium]